MSMGPVGEAGRYLAVGGLALVVLLLVSHFQPLFGASGVAVFAVWSLAGMSRLRAGLAQWGLVGAAAWGLSAAGSLALFFLSTLAVATGFRLLSGIYGLLVAVAAWVWGVGHLLVLVFGLTKSVGAVDGKRLLLPAAFAVAFPALASLGLWPWALWPLAAFALVLAFTLRGMSAYGTRGATAGLVRGETVLREGTVVRGPNEGEVVGEAAEGYVAVRRLSELEEEAPGGESLEREK